MFSEADDVNWQRMLTLWITGWKKHTEDNCSSDYMTTVLSWIQLLGKAIASGLNEEYRISQPSWVKYLWPCGSQKSTQDPPVFRGVCISPPVTFIA